jgi:sodium-dependent dicarboxylate transporter 2/3/5
MPLLSNKVITEVLYWVTRKKWLILAFALSIILFYVPSPEGLTPEGHRTLIIAVTALILIVGEVISLPAVGILILVMEVLLGLDTSDGVASSFMNDAVFFIMGSLMLAVAFVKQGWDSRIALGIIRLTGNKTRNIVFGFTAISALLSSFIGEHTVAALMLPLAMTLIRNTSKDHERVRELAAVLLFSIAYGSLIGSIGTPSGGGRNAILITYLQLFDVSISYIGWMKMVYPLVLLQIPILTILILTSFKPEYKQLDTGVRKLVVEVAKLGKMTGRATLAILIFLLVFAGWVFLSESLGLGTIALMGVFLYLVTGLVRWEDINRNTHWGVIILFGSTISLGSYIKSTGAALWLANHLISITGSEMDAFPIFTDAIIVVLTASLANILSSSATVAVLSPITLNMAADPLHVGMVTAIASSFGYFTAVAAPACTIVYSSGMIRAKDFLRAGWKVGLASTALLLIYANTYWLIFK